VKSIKQMNFFFHSWCVIFFFFNDQVIGGWADVLRMCERGHLQPQVLFFEAVN